MKEKETIAKVTEAKATEAKATVEQTQVEQAWKVLLESGVVTAEDKKVLEQRRRDRTLLGLASETLAKAKQIASDDNTVSVVITVGNWAYVADEGETRVIPRVTNAPQRRRKPDAGKAEGETSGAKANSEESNGIPIWALREASDRLGLKWFGPANATRSKRVVELARQIAERGEPKA